MLLCVWAQVVPVQAQERVKAQLASLAECSQVVTADSVILFFNARYELTPVACAAIRRHIRLTADGDMYGSVSDFRVGNGQLLARATYKEGRLYGLYELFYSSGQLAVRGQYEQGIRYGNWEYWYANGQPLQVFRFPTDGTTRIIAYWDTTGKAMVTNGQGVWQGQTERGLHSVGKVRLGLPDGQWRSYQSEGKQGLTAVELYEGGRFRKGNWQGNGQRRVPYFQPVVQPLTHSTIELASALRLGYSCNDQARRQQFAMMQEHLRVPSVALGTRRYAERLTQRMLRYSDTQWYQVLPDRVRVRASLDAAGQFIAFESENEALKQMLKRMLTQLMPLWKPAEFRGVPVPGYVDVEFNKATRMFTVRPAARLQPEQVPPLPVPDLM
ncbi:hypothetical protein GCM10023186_38950 [Hymenobacter koreensis]|uniref:Toxin-antitoxin system YwqK family antitoxin n=1 Tax=Hymenobacter koreensis TaxID=1084523 RepID=A0ABP8JGX8_9BACT